jgi:hypothetical protein
VLQTRAFRNRNSASSQRPHPLDCPFTVLQRTDFCLLWRHEASLSSYIPRLWVGTAMSNRKILCVAEKPAIAKLVAQHLSGGSWQTVSFGCDGVGNPKNNLLTLLIPTGLQRSITGNPYVKNYEFDFTFPPPWGSCSVTMTSVLGHLTQLDFEPQFKPWQSCPPGRLFDAPVVDSVAEVRIRFFQSFTPPSCQVLTLTLFPGQAEYCTKYQRPGEACQGTLYLDRLRPGRRAYWQRSARSGSCSQFSLRGEKGTIQQY